MRIRLILVGKTRRAEICTLVDDYISRIRRHAEVVLTEVRGDSAVAMRKLTIESSATVVLLDDAGRPQTSGEFATWVGKLRDQGVREIVFLCGGAEGFPEILRRRATAKLSLSSMTFSHELARVMLAEQLYRALATLAGHPYPK